MEEQESDIEMIYRLVQENPMSTGQELLDKIKNKT